MNKPQVIKYHICTLKYRFEIVLKGKQSLYKDK